MRSPLACAFGVPQGPGEHGRQHHPALLQRGHLHPGHREVGGLPARHPVRDLTSVRQSGGDGVEICERRQRVLDDGAENVWTSLS